MDGGFNSILSIALIPQTIALISDRENLDELSAINEFYRSGIYVFLADERTKMWHYSPMTLYTLWKHEKKTGEIVFPEE